MRRRDFLKGTLAGAAVLGACSLAPSGATGAFAQNAPKGDGKKRIKLGASAMLFKPRELETIAPYIKAAGFDGTTVVIKTLLENFGTQKWKDEIKRLKTIASDNGLEFLSSGGGGRGSEQARRAFETAAGLGIPVLCTGSGGKTGDEASYNKTIDELGAMARIAAEYKIFLASKAHDGTLIHTTAGTLRMVRDINNPWFGADIDPYHVFLAGESLTEAAKTLAPWLKYAHAQDYRFSTDGKFKKCSPLERACGRGDVDIPGYVKALIDGGFDGPLMVEHYGDSMDLNVVLPLASQGHGYLRACLKILK